MTVETEPEGTASHLLSHPDCQTARALIDELSAHPLYSGLSSFPRILVFMKYQVWCVWDFMTLVKGVQLGVGSFFLPWRPNKSPLVERLIGEVALEEEADELSSAEGPAFLSHFEFFRNAMLEAGADTSAIDGFLKDLGRGESLEFALSQCSLPEPIRGFVLETVEIATGPVEGAIGALLFGRETLVPGMFETLRANLRARRLDRDARLERFMRYLDRHIELDRLAGAAAHENKLTRIFQTVCNEPESRRVGIAGGVRALKARKRFLDGVFEEVVGEVG